LPAFATHNLKIFKLFATLFPQVLNRKSSFQVFATFATMFSKKNLE